MTEEEFSEQLGNEVTALVNSFVTSGRQTAGNPQFIAELNVINQKYNSLIQQAQQQAQVQQQQTTTQDTGALANVGTDTQQQDTGQKVYLTSNQGNLIPGQKSSRFVYMVDQDTGQQYVYDDNEGKSGDTGWQSGAPPTGANLKITAINSKQDEDWNFTDVSDFNLTWGGVTDPETLAQYTAQANRDDPSDNDVFYTDPQGVQRVDVTGTGQSIPVGSTNITRDPTQLGQYDDEGNFTKYDASTYTQPVLTKTFQSYEPVTGMVSDVEGITPEQYANLSNQEKLKLAQSDVPTASTDFKDFFDMGSGQFDLGGFFGMDIDPTTGTSSLVLSNPPSNQFNLEKFLIKQKRWEHKTFKKSEYRCIK